MSETLLIRADAGPRIGAGHVMRCLALAQVWADDGGRTTFLMSDGPPALADRVQAEGAEVNGLEQRPGGEEDASRLIGLAKESDAGWVVVDGYHFDANYLRWVSESGLRLLWLHDGGKVERCEAELVLNQNLHARPGQYPRTIGRDRLLLGTRYTLLRKEYRRRAGSRPRQVRHRAKRVLVTAGGSDGAGLLSRAAQALRPLDLEAIYVIGSVDDGGVKELESTAGEKATVLSAVEDMAQLMVEADLAISAAGSTAWELAFLGVPSLLVVAADNQRPVAEALAAAGAAIDLGEAASLTPTDLRAAVVDLARDVEARRGLAASGPQLVDGRGAARVVARMKGQRCRLRPAASSDSRRIWEWANDPAVRAASFSSADIEWEEHQAWFVAKLESPVCRQYIAIDELGEPVGQVRVDWSSGSEDGEFDISVAPAARRCGVGAWAIDLAAGRIFGDTPLRRLHAFVKSSNEASRRSFLRAGFTELEPTSRSGCSARHLVLKRGRSVGL